MHEFGQCIDLARCNHSRPFSGLTDFDLNGIIPGYPALCWFLALGAGLIFGFLLLILVMDGLDE